MHLIRGQLVEGNLDVETRPFTLYLEATGMAKALPPKIDCIVNANLPNAVLGTLDYFSGIRTVPLTSTSAGKCHWLVMYGEPRDAK